MSEIPPVTPGGASGWPQRQPQSSLAPMLKRRERPVTFFPLSQPLEVRPVLTECEPAPGREPARVTISLYQASCLDEAYLDQPGARIDHWA